MQPALNVGNRSIYGIYRLVYIDTSNNTFHTKLYTKPTYKNQYLHYHSEHPFHVKKAIPFSQAIRLRRIIDDESLFQEELRNLEHRFLG